MTKNGGINPSDPSKLRCFPPTVLPKGPTCATRRAAPHDAQSSARLPEVFSMTGWAKLSQPMGKKPWRTRVYGADIDSKWMWTRKMIGHI